MLWNAVLWHDRPHAVVTGILELLELLRYSPRDERVRDLLPIFELCSACYGLQRATKPDIPLFCLFALNFHAHFCP